jgi:hypothetical protein
MTSKSTLGAIAFIAAIGLAPPAFAASPGPYGPEYNGGGSTGYNHQVATDYRLKHHQAKHTQSSETNK